MATTYPGTVQAFTNYAGTSLMGDIDHAAWHAVNNDTTKAVEDVLGTTAGTSVLKNMAAGDFVPTQATGAEVNTGTATLKYVSPSAITNSNIVVKVVNYETGAVATGTTVIPADDSIPQNTEGDEYMTLAITPRDTTNILIIEAVAHVSYSDAGKPVVALFQDTTAGALAVSATYQATANGLNNINLTYKMVAGGTTATTFKIRVGSNASGTTTFNGSAAGRGYGGVLMSSMTITEYKA